MSSQDEKSVAGPPAYVIGSCYAAECARKEPAKSKGRCGLYALLGWAVAASTALIVVLVIGGVYYSRTADLLQQAITTYQVLDKTGPTPVTHTVAVDSAQNVVVFNLAGDDVAPGTFSVLDYTKSLIGLYEPTGRNCYLIAGMLSGFADLTTLQTMLIGNVTNTNASAVATYYYKLSNSYPISDKSILPSPMQSACTSLPVYWMEPTAAPTNHGISKRGFWSSVVNVFKKVVAFVKPVLKYIPAIIGLF